MALLKNAQTHAIHVLHAQHPVGRNVNACKTVVDAEDVSRSHATLYWSEGDWFLRDHSRNGTLVDGTLLRDAVQRLRAGMVLQFGSESGTQWALLDVDAPCSYLVRLDNQELAMLDVCRALPDERQPELLFFQDAEHAWHMEMASGTTALRNGSTFHVGGVDWTFVENEALPETKDYGRVVQDAVFCFYLSADEEDIRLAINTTAQEFDLGHRTYNTMLLTLVRQRLADIADGLASADQGWIEVERLERLVGKELGREVDSYYLNLQVFRLRKQLVELKPYGHLFSNCIARRPGEIRFAFPQVKIMQEDRVVAEYPAPIPEPTGVAATSAATHSTQRFNAKPRTT